jgi:hypothetical protein
MNHSCRIHLAHGIIHAIGRGSVRKTTPARLSHPTSISSSEKEVSHGHEEAEEEEDVEVTRQREPRIGARIRFVLREATGREAPWRYDSGRTQSRPLLFSLDTILYSTSLSNRCFCARASDMRIDFDRESDSSSEETRS